jgi:hypothetical protein
MKSEHEQKLTVINMKSRHIKNALNMAYAADKLLVADLSVAKQRFHKYIKPKLTM